MAVALRAQIRSFRYPGTTFPALSNIDLALAAGEYAVVVGPAGSGKTTLCYCLAGIIPKAVRGELDGTVEAAGRDIATLPLPQVGPLLGFVMQSPENQLFNVTVAEDVAFGPENLGLPPEEVAARVRRSLAFTGTSHLADRFSHLLSGGESQRVVLAAVLALEAGIFIFDQPAAELDPAGRRAIYAHLARLNHAGKTVVLVEDRLDEVAAHATRILLLAEGRIVRDLPPRAFFADPTLPEYGVRLPAAVDLFHRLREAGQAPADLPLALDEAVEQLRPLLPDDPPRYPGAETGDPPSAGALSPNTPAHHAPPPQAPPPAPPVVEAEGVVHRYPGGVEALAGVDLTVLRGEFVAVIGENGAGKTTLAKHLVGLLRPTRGRVRILGRDIARLPVHEISRRVGFLFQDPDYQIFNDSCLEEAAYGLRLRRMPAAEARERALAALERVGLADAAGAHPYTLSRGQRQRLAVASVLAMEPALLIIDEPTSGLDVRETLAMMRLLDGYRRDGATILAITHDVDLAARFADRLVVLSGGRILRDAPATGLREALRALQGTAALLPESVVLAERLGLPGGVQSVPEIAAALTVAGRRRAATGPPRAEGR